MALVENDLPMALRILVDGRFEEIGRVDYNGKLKHPFTAHPKIDPKTKELLFFGYQLEKKPWCTYSVVSSEGKLIRSTDIGLSRPIMMHDFAITENFSIFMDHPLEFTPKDIVSGKFAFQFNSNQPSRIGVIPRHGSSASDVQWFEFKSGFSFHTANAWEDGDEIVMICCRSNDLQLGNLGKTRDSSSPYLHQYRMNLKTGESSERDLNGQVACEFPVVHPDLVGRKNKFCYCGELAPSGLTFIACVKYNLEDGSVVGRIPFGENRGGGECVFVPKDDAKSEDDGYLLTFIYDEPSNSSSLWVMDALTMAEDPIAKIELPQRVPYGFHGIWVSEDEILAQLDQ